jgi:hypothetical protein
LINDQYSVRPDEAFRFAVSSNIQNKKNESFLEQMLSNWKTYSYIYTIVSRSFHLQSATPLTVTTQLIDVKLYNVLEIRFIKNSFRSTMGEDRFNALILLYVHKDIEIDIQI